MLLIENLTKTYGEKKAVDNLSIHIAPVYINYIGHDLKCVERNPDWERNFLDLKIRPQNAVYGIYCKIKIFENKQNSKVINNR